MVLSYIADFKLEVPMDMNLTDMLNYTDIQQLSRIASHYECECSGNSKNELIQSILTKVNKKEVSEQIINSASLEDLRLLNSLLFESRNLYSLEELISKAKLTRFTNENDEWNPRDIIAKFKQRGWLFNGYSQQTKYLFQIPTDLKARFSDLLSKHFSKTIVTSTEPSLYRDEQNVMQDDIYHFLHFVHHNEPRLTTDGFLYKKQVHQILECFTVREQALLKQGWRFGYGRKFKEYPNRFSFIYDYCFFQKYITEHPDFLELSDQGKSIVASKRKVDNLELYRFWIKLYRTPIKNLQSFIFWIDSLAKDWITVTSLKNTLCSFIKPFYYDDAVVILEQRILQMMMHLGLIRLGESDSEKVIQITKLGTSLIHGTYVSEEEQLLSEEEP